MAKHKCKIPDPPMDTTRWMGTYGDMVTLLMAFFVMLFAVSETSNQKFVAFVSGLAGPFDNPSLELGLVDGASLEQEAVSPIALIAPNPGAGSMSDRVSSEDARELLEAQEQLDQVQEDLREVLDASEVPIIVDVRDDERGLVVSISTDEILFAVGSAEMAEAGKQLIGEIAPILVNAPNTIVIEGHTDNTPLNTDGYSNWNLSTDRAVAVLELLGEAHGMSYDRISATGFGEHRPLMDNDSEASRSINRRVEILIVGLNVSRGGEAPPPSGQVPEQDPGAFAPPPGEQVVSIPPGETAIETGLPPRGPDPVGAGEDVASGGGGSRDGPRQASANPATLATIMGQ